MANAGIHNLHPYPCTSVMFSPRGEGEALCGLNQAGMALMTGHGSFPMPCMFPDCGKRGKHTWRGSSHKSQLALGSLLPRQFHLKFGRAALKRIGSEPLVRALACSKKRPTGCKNSHSPHPAETIGNHFGFTSPSGFGKVLLAAGNQFSDSSKVDATLPHGPTCWSVSVGVDGNLPFMLSQLRLSGTQSTTGRNNVGSC